MIQVLWTWYYCRSRRDPVWEYGESVYTMYPNFDRSSEFLNGQTSQPYLVEGFANKGYF